MLSSNACRSRFGATAVTGAAVAEVTVRSSATATNVYYLWFHESAVKNCVDSDILCYLHCVLFS